MSSQTRPEMNGIDVDMCETGVDQFSVSYTIASEDIANKNLKTDFDNYYCNISAAQNQNLKIMHSGIAIDVDNQPMTVLPEFQSEYQESGSSSSSPQSGSESQTTSIKEGTTLEAQSRVSGSDSLTSDVEEPSSSVSSTNYFMEIASFPDELFVGSSEQSPPNTSSSENDWKQKSLRYPPCAVCSGKSSGLHYGCYTCEACKNFFRRFLLRNGGFHCKKENNCVIANRSRGNCSGCRLKKCLEVGMSKEKSKIGRYTHTQRTETIREVNKLEGKLFTDEIEDKTGKKMGPVQLENSIAVSNGTDDNMSISEAPSDSEQVSLTETEQRLLKELTESLDAIEHFGERGKTAEGRKQIIDEHHERYLAKVKMFGPLKAIPKDEYFTLLRLYNIDLDGRWKLFKQEANNCAHIVERYCKFAYKIPGFQTLSIKDQESLLKVGHCEFFVILMHEGYDDEHQIYLEMNGVPAHIEESADKIFSRELIEIQAEIFRRWQKARLLKEEQTLLCAMSLLCSDRIDFENPAAIEKVHTELTDLLMKVLRINYGKDAHKRFAKFIDILMFCRQAAEAYYKEYQEMSQLDMIQQVAPAFPTLCPEKF